MKFRMLVPILTVFAFVFSLTIGLYSSAMAIPGFCTDGGRQDCDCCETLNESGTWRYMAGQPGQPPGHWVCTCTGCDDGGTGNPCECTLDCGSPQ